MIESQFSQPKGTLGKLAGWFMAKENKTLNQWTLSFLNIKENERVLEIGSGPGSAVKELLKYKSCEVYAIDPSEAMVETTLRRLQKLRIDNQVCMIHGKASEVENMSLPFDKVYSINNMTYWENPVQTLQYLNKHMRPSGKIALTLCPHEEGATDETTDVLSGQLSSFLEKAGFRNIETFIKHTKPNNTVCAVGMV